MPRFRNKKDVAVAFIAAMAALTFTASACGCASQGGSASESAQAQAQTTNAAWSLEADCGQCHTNEAASQSNSACLASLHAANNCMTCHVDEASLTTQHEGATADTKMPKKLKKTSVGTELCLSCHGSWEELAGATASLTVLTDDEGTIVNPHDLPAGHVDEKVTCADCHTMHAEEDTSEAAVGACQSCHHKNVYTCNTCH